ncbi:uncharacterized protein isoform X3 [Leptinotarsa decemlineata]|uniref:uncharacterized protein isoform X3 n=1 Tax=Leptinotarsa decemlineata TaxID=7539 RepID=UPI003D30577D
MKIIALFTVFTVLVTLVNSHPGIQKSNDIAEINGELEEINPLVRGVRAVCDDAFCAKMCRLDRKRGGRCWGSVCVCDRP